ncbi:MAG: hypothetical protein LLG06_05310 [Desulfobacteraceae bacterium]|nr:hypothetical protein [Desulfobacteraceae bacterium]
MKYTLNNEKGIALITTLMFVALGFSIIAILLRMVTVETKMARLEQSYSIALDGAKGGADMFIFLVQNGLTAPPSPGIGTGTAVNSGHCFHVKLNYPTASWVSQSEWTTYACPTQAVATDPDPTAQPDFTMTLSNHTVSVKIIDTIQTQPAAAAPCLNGCSYYTVNVRSQATGTGEHADITFVYRYDM